VSGCLGWRSGLGAALLVGRSRDRFPVVSLDFSATYSFRPYHDPGVDSAPSENEYQEHFLGVKKAGAWGWRPHHLRVSNVMEIWAPKLRGTLRATPGLLRHSFTFIIRALHRAVWSYKVIDGCCYLTLSAQNMCTAAIVKCQNQSMKSTHKTVCNV
jgi:hypothetical protein